MQLHTVNELIGAQDKFHGQRLYVEGLLTFETDNISINHWPKAEQNGPGIWLCTGEGAFGFNTDAMDRLAGKKVVCLGEFQASFKPDYFDGEWGFGPYSIWSAQLLATELVYYKTWLKAIENNSAR